MAIHAHELIAQRPHFLGPGEWRLQNLNHITVLFGKNGSGKSVLLRTLLSDTQESRHLALPERPGEIEANPNLASEESMASTRAGNRRQNTLSNYRNRAFSRIQTLIQKRGFHMEPGSTDNSIREIEGLMKDLLPDFTFELTGDMPHFRILRADGSTISNANEISSGEAGMVSLAVDLLTMCAIWKLERREDRMLLIDEPDTHLHPDLQEFLAAFIVRLVDAYAVQIIVATHSTTLLSALGHHGKNRTSALYLNRSAEPQRAVKFTEHLQELSSCLGGHALMGPLFGAPLLLVEGDDDYRIWSQVPRHHMLKLAVLPCDGEEIYKYQKTLEQIFMSLRTAGTAPAGFALLDADKSLPSLESTPQQHVAFLRLACHEAENLYLTDEVLLALKLDWSAAQEEIVAAAPRFGSKASVLASCGSWDRKTQDLKLVINELGEILDKKSVHWTKRVGTAIGAARPSGQLAEFLGPDVMRALWP